MTAGTTFPSPSHLPDTPPTVVIKATHGLSALHLRAVWEYRELLYFLVWRDVKVATNRPRSASRGWSCSR